MSLKRTNEETSEFNPTRVIWVEGIIGCGKTTLTTRLAKALEYHPVYEPMNHRLLNKFYLDQEKWAFEMQIDLLHRRFALQKSAAYASTIGQGSILDRGLPGDRVFAKMLYEDGKINGEQWEIYQRCYEIMTCSLFPPSLLIFLDVEPKVALERIRNRDRAAERNLIPLSYLIRLQEGYEQLLVEIESGNHTWSRGITVKRIQCNGYPNIDVLAFFVRNHSI